MYYEQKQYRDSATTPRNHNNFKKTALRPPQTQARLGTVTAVACLRPFGNSSGSLALHDMPGIQGLDILSSLDAWMFDPDDPVLAVLATWVKHQI